MATPTEQDPQGTPLKLPPRWVAALVAVALVAVGGVVVLRLQDHSAQCSADVLLEGRSPLLSPAQMKDQPDERLDALAGAIGEMGKPFGPVRAGIGYDYDQYLHLYGVAGGVLAWTKNNAPVTMLDATTLRPRWSLRPSSTRTAWDASSNRFLLLDLEADEKTRVSSYELGNGHRLWCTNLADPQKDGDPVATTFLDGGDVLTALASKPGTIRVTRLGGTNGHRLWTRELTEASRADYLGTLTDDLAIVGGTEDYRLTDDSAVAADGPSISAINLKDGTTAWTWGPGAKRAAHVVGVDGGRVIVQVVDATGTSLIALGGDGKETWRTGLVDTEVQATLRGTTMITRSDGGLDGYDVATGKRRWHRDVPTDRTYFPYGFTLGQMPSLDDRHVLVPTTAALLVLDLTDGSTKTFRLPTNGVSTTYWPYQLMVTDSLIGVVTNTGGVVASRE